MSESRPVSGMASGAVLRPSAQVNEGQKRTRRVRDWERERDREMENRDMGSILVDYQTEGLETRVQLLILQAERETYWERLGIGDRMYGEERSM